MSELEMIVGGSIPLFWVAIGIVALIVEVLLPSGFVLSFSVSSFVLAATYYFAGFPAHLLERIAFFVVLGVLLISPIRWLLKRTAGRNPDINQY